MYKKEINYTRNFTCRRPIMYKKKYQKKKLPKVGFTRYGHPSHIKGMRRLLANKAFRKKFEIVSDKQCKRLEKELVK